MEKLIKEAFNLFERIGSTTSRLEKEGYLRQGSDNPVFRELLYKCYNPFLMFNIKKVPDHSGVKNTNIDGDMYEVFLELLNDLHTRATTGNAAVEEVEKILCVWCSELEHKWYTKVLQKDLKIGITEATINDVFGKNFIPEYSCMLAHPIKKYPKRYVGQPKLDGYRINAFHDFDGTVVLKSRNGKVIEGYTLIEEEVSKYLPRGFMYDGEIMSRIGGFNATQTQVSKKGVSNKDGVLHMFDVISIEEFNLGKGTLSYADRLGIMVSLQTLLSGSNSMLIVEHTRTLTDSDHDIERLMEYHVGYVNRGYEGTMVKDLDAVYECKRSRAVQKVKDMDTIDLVVVGVEEGKKGTKNEGTLGALVADFKGNTVNVGSGYSDELRAEIWANRTDIINRTIEIKYQEITKNKLGTESLRFPVFVQIRTDK